LPEDEIHPREALERGRKLEQALLDRHVEGRQRLRADAAGVGKAVARLEAPHRLGHGLVVRFAFHLVGGEIVGHDEAPPQ
jgi:hypothetical protein